MTAAALTGFFTGLSLILAIGAQNAFVLRQGLVRRHVFALCLLCALSDAILVSLGVAGFGWLVRLNPHLPVIMALAGAGFLLVYGGLRFWSALRGTSSGSKFERQDGLWKTLLLGLALTWLNPHVYLDTLGLIGAVSTQYEPIPEKFAFGAGAVLASFAFFFSLGYGARFLSPIMQTPRAWRIFDVLVGVIMWVIAARLLTF